MCRLYLLCGCGILWQYINPFEPAMNLKPANIPSKFKRAPALVELLLRLQQRQDNPILRKSPAVQEMKKKQGL